MTSIVSFWRLDYAWVDVGSHEDYGFNFGDCLVILQMIGRLLNCSRCNVVALMCEASIICIIYSNLFVSI